MAADIVPMSSSASEPGRMGAICVDFDPYGWGQSEAEYGKNSHQTDRAHVIQSSECTVLLDYI